MKDYIKIDFWFLFILFVLILFGTWILFSSSSIIAHEKYKDAFYFANKQILWHFMGLFFMFISLFIPISFFKKFSKILIYFSIIILSLVFFPGIGKSVSNQYSFDFKRWIQIGPISLQPSEFIKITYLFYLSFLLEKISSYESQKQLFYDFMPLLIILILLLLQPQYGTMILFLLTTVILIYISGFPVLRLLLLGISITPFIFILGIFQPYRFERIKVWLDPYTYKYDQGYQLVMAFRAFKEGGLWGTDISKGIAHKYLTFGHTDFIFALIGESLGILGILFTILIFFLLFFRAFQLIQTIDEPFYYIFSTGIITLLILQVIINLCVTTGLIPTTGIGLPFISYGGSSLISYYIMMGIFLNLTKSKK